MPRSTTRPLLWLFAPYVVASIAHVALIRTSLSQPTKLLLMPALLIPVLVLWRKLRSPLVPVLLLAAIVFSWLGDGAGQFFPEPELPFMLGFFGLAHLAYMYLFGRVLPQRRIPPWTLVYAVWWVVTLAVLWRHVGSLLPAVAVYGLVLAGTATLAARCGPIVTLGGVFFLASDTILAFRLFRPDLISASWGSPAVMATYTLGQGLLVLGALLLATREPTQGP